MKRNDPALQQSSLQVQELIKLHISNEELIASRNQLKKHTVY
jgi:hypothetical protein